MESAGDIEIDYGNGRFGTVENAFRAFFVDPDGEEGSMWVSLTDAGPPIVVNCDDYRILGGA